VASNTVAAVVDRGPCHPRSPTAATTTQIRARGNGVHWNLTTKVCGYQNRVYRVASERRRYERYCPDIYIEQIRIPKYFGRERKIP